MVKGLISSGHNVALLANSESTIKLDQFYSWPGKESGGIYNSIINIKALNHALNSFNPDIVHSFSRLLYMLNILPKKIPKIMSYQRYPSIHTIKNSLRISRGTLRFTGCSKYICRLGSNIGGKWDVIHNFVELNKYDFNPLVKKNAPLVFLSRVERIKGAHTAIKAALNSRKELIIAGNADLDSQYWKNEIKPYLGKNGIEYLGPVNDIEKNELLGNALALIVPIEWDEPFGIVFAESLACGTPVISCPRGALPEIVNNGINGFLCEEFNTICNSIEKIENLDRLTCRNIAENNFSSNIVINKYEKLYNSLI